MKVKLVLCSIIIPLIVIGSTVSQSSVTSYLNEMDSLGRLVDSHQGEDQEKVKFLNEYARLCFYNNEYYNGFIAAHSAKELSEKLDYQDGLVMYYLTLSSFHTGDDMRTFYRKKAQWLSNLFDQQLDKFSTYTIIQGYGMNDDLEELESEFNKTLKHFEDLEDPEFQANISIGPLVVAYRRANTEAYQKISERVIKLFSDANEIYPVLVLSLYQLDDLINSGQAEEAKQLELEIIKLITKHEDEATVGLITNTMANSYRERGRWDIAIEYYIKSTEIFQQNNDLESLVQAYYQLGVCYENMGFNSRAADSYKKCIATIEERGDTSMSYHAHGTLIFPLIALEKYDEAAKYMELALRDTIRDNRLFVLARYNDANGQILRNQGRYDEAIPYFEKALKYFTQYGFSSWAPPFMKLYLAECYYEMGDYDNALEQGIESLEMENAQHSENTLIKNKVSLLLSETFERMGDLPTAYEYLKMHQNIRSESEERDEANRVADAEIRAILEKSEKEIDALEEIRLQNEQESKIQKLWIFSIGGAFFFAILLTIILYRNNKSKQNANAVLQDQKEELESTLKKLKAAQNQLVHAEKMASLGELTAGIAHEIQNPLNFVNNFSEVSNELIDEVREEMAGGDIKEVNAILDDLKKNLTKITHHGERASGIVRSMLDHSRNQTGEKVNTDINALCDEYLRLAYHRMRARDRSFNARFETHLDPALPRINVVAQDTGRVLLNLINNAFQAISEKEELGEVIVSTKNIGDKIEIKVADNGPGIPDDIKDKVFQPFFTTKSTGQGTGLGLSLSYDIIKAHGGELTMESNEGDGTTFIIRLPIHRTTVDAD